MSDAKNLLLFFDRPLEPCFMQKGDDKTVLDIPNNYYPEKYQKVCDSLRQRFRQGAGRSVEVRNIAMPAGLDEVLALPYNENISLFLPRHMEIAAKLIKIFMNMRDLEDLQSVCSYCQLRINPYMFNYCLSVCILHRPDTKGLDIPILVYTFPEKFMDPKVFRTARQYTAETEPKEPIPIPINNTASDLEPEQRLAYFREDLGVNLHHWHWHLVYPTDPDDKNDSWNIVNKDRRGELFYYMHQQIVARYNCERFCNGLRRVSPYNNFREPIEEGYFPKLDSQVANRSWPPRFAGTTIRDIDRTVDRTRMQVVELQTYRDRFLTAIEKMAVLMPNGTYSPLTEDTGIDVLGNMMESSVLSPNRPYYGNLHGMGHNFISYSHDLDHRNLEPFGVMGDPGTAMRDPVFYRWHSYVDDIFQLYKNKLTPYDPEKLKFPGIKIETSGFSIEGSAGPNTLATKWEVSILNLDKGLDFMKRGPVLAEVTHLQHEEFKYVIKVNNTSGEVQMGMFRIFIAPTKDEQGAPLTFDEQRKLMIELDKFTRPIYEGINTIEHRSIDSTVTIPYERVFRSQDARPGVPGTAAAAAFDFCGCGWPHHMLVPRGTAEGFPMVLFCMISNGEDDMIEQDTVGSCNDAASYCGIRDRKYPDRRAMGYPFDRPASNANSLGDFLQPNMAVSDCTIRFNDEKNQKGKVIITS